jgi:hypothetical protein
MYAMTHQGASGMLAITQLAIVVKDLQTTMELYHRTLGWGPWSVFEFGPPLLHDTVVRGVPTPFTVLAAGTQVGPLEVELLQPVDGPSIYQEWLDRHGEGLHHIIGMKVGRDTTALRQEFADLGIPELMSGCIGQNLRFVYLDSQPVFKFILEMGSGDESDAEWDHLKPTYIYPPPE